MADDPLAGIGVLVTRPAGQSQELAAQIERLGGRPILFPSLEIVPRDRAAVRREVEALAAPDITIFISRNAVAHGIDYAAGRLAAIGPATAAAVRNAGHDVDILPASGYDSEHLLAEPDFIDMAGKRVRIIRGGGGREKLAETLRGRGAAVDYVSAYERRLPHHSADEIDRLERRWSRGEIDAVVVMSVQSLDNLVALLPDACRRRLRETLLVTPAARVLKQALKRHPGWPVLLSAGPHAPDIASCLASGAGRRATATSDPDGTDERNR